MRMCLINKYKQVFSLRRLKMNLHTLLLLVERFSILGSSLKCKLRLATLQKHQEFNRAFTAR